jgi:hypothetical protein
MSERWGAVGRTRLIIPAKKFYFRAGFITRPVVADLQ